MRAAVVLATALLAACGDSLPQASPRPSPAATRDGRWVQDVDYLASELPRLHPNLFFQTPRSEFDRVVDEVRRAVPAAQDHEVVVGLMRIAALPGDGHTSLHAMGQFVSVPVQLTRLAEGLYVTAAHPTLAAMLGARVTGFGTRTAAEAESAASALVSHENEAWLRVQVPRLLVMPQVVHALRVTGDPTAITLWLEDANGAVFSRTLVASGDRPTLDLATAAGASPPLHLQRVDNYWLTFLEPSRTLYVQYNRCQQGPEPFRAFADRLLAYLDDGRAARLVVDVRHNGGGDSQVDDPLIDGIQDRAAWRAPGRVICLIGGETYSSGLWTADDLKRRGALLVGEPTGGRPNSYGNVRTFLLPNSRIEVGYSTQYFRLVSGSDPVSLAPDLTVAPTLADLRAGRDPLLETAIAYSPR